MLDGAQFPHPNLHLKNEDINLSGLQTDSIFTFSRRARLGRAHLTSTPMLSTGSVLCADNSVSPLDPSSH
ncbi:hypothetical protein J6590_004911 [Homalodisca vitripennis]|nr:hypothetical protein J6590_004911 [Homalodisca vitripennis]